MIELLVEAERALAFGLLDRAEAIYRQVAEVDPRNSIAVVGLARVAVERRDDAEALRLARRALEIDPENEAAQRLAARLDEIIRTRGDDLPGTAPAEPPRPTPAAPGGSPPTPPPRPRKRRSVLDRLRRH